MVIFAYFSNRLSVFQKREIYYGIPSVNFDSLNFENFILFSIMGIRELTPLLQVFDKGICKNVLL